MVFLFDFCGWVCYNRGTKTKGGNGNVSKNFEKWRRDLGRVRTEDLTEDMVKTVIEQGLSRGEYCGVWIDDGFAYVDISKRIKTKQEAMRLGREKKQLSILDWRKNECLAVV